MDSLGIHGDERSSLRRGQQSRLPVVKPWTIAPFPVILKEKEGKCDGLGTWVAVILPIRNSFGTFQAVQPDTVPIIVWQ